MSGRDFRVRMIQFEDDKGFLKAQIDKIIMRAFFCGRMQRRMLAKQEKSDAKWRQL